MKWIGFNRYDQSGRKFEFDDSETMNGDPKVYSIRFIDNGEMGSIECEKVFKLKPLKNENRRLSNTPKPNPGIVMPPVEDFPNNIVGVDVDQMIDDIAAELTPKRKVSKPEPAPPKKETKIPVTFNSGSIDMPAMIVPKDDHKYEYKIMLDDFDGTSPAEDALNILGSEGWEMVGFNFVLVPHSLLSNKAKLFCILKRIKR